MQRQEGIDLRDEQKAIRYETWKRRRHLKSSWASRWEAVWEMHSDGVDCHTDWERGRLEGEGDEFIWGMLSLGLSRDGQVDLLLGK